MFKCIWKEYPSPRLHKSIRDPLSLPEFELRVGECWKLGVRALLRMYQSPRHLSFYIQILSICFILLKYFQYVLFVLS